MASFIDRCIRTGDWADDGSAVDILNFQLALAGLDAEVINATQLKALFNCTTGQAAELDEILAKRPPNQNSVPAARWARNVIGILGVALLDINSGVTPVTTLTTAAAVRTALELDP